MLLAATLVNLDHPGRQPLPLGRHHLEDGKLVLSCLCQGLSFQQWSQLFRPFSQQSVFQGFQQLLLALWDLARIFHLWFNISCF